MPKQKRENPAATMSTLFGEDAMARKGDRGVDFRSESERVKPRAGGSPFGDESTSSGASPQSVPHAGGNPAALVKGGASEKDRLTVDRALQEEIVSQLSLQPESATCEIVVEVRDRVVALTGSADTINAKYRIEEIAKRVDGIERVENNLGIRVGEALEEFTRNADAARLREAVVRGSKNR